MRIFNHRNINGKDVCLICNTNHDGETVLIPIVGKEKGNNCEALQFHLECLNLWLDEDLGIIYQKVKQQEKCE